MVAPDQEHPVDRARVLRARDLLLVPSLLSLSRVPLALVFPFCSRDAPLAFGVIVLAGLTDLLDGWWARRFNQTTAIGAAVDGATDKIFVLSVALSMLWAGLLTPLAVLWLGTRDLGELAIAAFMALRGDRRKLSEEHRANQLGKLTTFMQFVAVTLCLFRWPGGSVLTILAGAVGVVAAASYVHFAARATEAEATR
ncbi:MAG: CDP-alcohol phosphatidyltransferase family protein [Polyangiaceae bacterium]